MNPIEVWLKGQGIAKPSYIDDSRELLVDQVMSMIDEGLGVLLESDPNQLAETIVTSAQEYQKIFGDFRGNVGDADTVFHAAAKTIAILIASYAQVLRDTEGDDSE